MDRVVDEQRADRVVVEHDEQQRADRVADRVNKYDIFDTRCYTFDASDRHTMDTTTEALIRHVKNGLLTFHDGDTPLVLSLSGGVDSMVLLDAFCKIGFEFHCLHIDYGNRLETDTEAEYLQKYCATRSVPLTCYRMPIQRGDDARNRSEYERITKERRFSEYKKLCDEVGTNIVVLGHHDDDIIENIICNALTTQNLDDLGKMHLKSAVDTEYGLQLVRPLIGKMKEDVYQYAEANDIFYFRDSTPKWSKRGQIRDRVLPQLENVFPGAREHLLRFNNINTSNSRLLRLMLARYTNFDFTAKDDGTKILGIPCHLGEECALVNEIGLWRHVFTEATKRMGHASISQKSLHNFMENLGKRRVTLSRNVHVENDGGRFTIVFSPSSTNSSSSRKD